MNDAPPSEGQAIPNQPGRHLGWWFLFAVVVLLFAVVLSVLYPWYRQTNVIARLEAKGVHFQFEPVGPEWLRDLWGEERMQGFDDIITISAENIPLTDGELAEISYLTKLSSVVLTNTKVTDAGLVHLKELSNLQNLCLGDLGLTDDGLVHLGGLTNLELLSLHDSQVSDDGLAQLKELNHLYWLDLSNTQVTDNGLVHLKKLNNLRWVPLSDTNVTASGVEELQQALPDCDIDY